MVFALRSSHFKLCFHGWCLSRRQKRADSIPGSSPLSPGFAEEQNCHPFGGNIYQLNNHLLLPGVLPLQNSWQLGGPEKFHSLEIWSWSLSIVDKQQKKVASTFLPSCALCTTGKGASLKTMICNWNVSLLAPKKVVAENCK